MDTLNNMKKADAGIDGHKLTLCSNVVKAALSVFTCFTVAAWGAQ
jgi:uncharacterized membrane protein